MILFEIPGEYEYELRSLSGAFYPEHTCQIIVHHEWDDEEGYPIICRMDGKEVLTTCIVPRYDKDEVKRVVYRALAAESGKTLPWGILTGIRPAKVALRMLMEGETIPQVISHMQDRYLVTLSKARLAVDVAAKEHKLLGPLDRHDGYSIYIGIPFCPTICEYCSFSSYDYRSYRDKVDAYLTALDRELEAVSHMAQGRGLHTVYIGGGTPSSLDDTKLQRLMDMVHRHIPVSELLEYTVEAGRPDSITRDKLRIMKAAGVTRISVNPQTMNDETLGRLGRRHTVDQVRQAYAMAREEGFTDINMDLIIGLPGEDEEDFRRTLDSVYHMHPDSITIHTLVIKRASRMRKLQLEKGQDMYPADSQIQSIQNMGEDMLRGYGYAPYYMYRQKNKAGTTYNTNQENVAYAKSGKECLYNMLIMEEWETIVALGSGGSTKYVVPDEDRMERIANVKNVDDYISRIDEMIERKNILWH